MNRILGWMVAILAAGVCVAGVRAQAPPSAEPAAGRWAAEDIRGARIRGELSLPGRGIQLCCAYYAGNEGAVGSAAFPWRVLLLLDLTGR